MAVSCLPHLTSTESAFIPFHFDSHQRSEDGISKVEALYGNLDLVQVFLRHCGVEYKKSAGSGTRIHLVDVGPSLDLTIRRHREPSDDLRKEATKTVPKSTKKKVKGIDDGVVGVDESSTDREFRICFAATNKCRFPNMLNVTVFQVKNVKGDSLAGKVGRIYMPKQEVMLCRQYRFIFILLSPGHPYVLT